MHEEEYRSLMENTDALVQKFVDVSTEIKNLTRELEQIHETSKKTESDIGFKRQVEWELFVVL